MRTRTLVISLLFFQLLFICHAEETINFDPPNLEPNTVISISNSYLSKNGINLDEYQMVAMSFDYFKRIWWILYILKEPILGGHFSVTIEDKKNPNIEIEGGA